MLTLFKRKDAAIYYMRGTVAGLYVYESTKCSHKPTAEIMRIKRQAELLQTRAFGKAQTLTFAQAALTYIEGGGERRFLGKIIKHFGPDAMIKDTDNAAILAAARALYPDASPATINRQLITPISAVVNMAADEGLTRHRRFKRRKAPKTPTRWLTPEEAERLLACASDHLRPIIMVLIGTGARTSEALGIEAAFYYPNTSEIWLPNVKNGIPRMLKMPGRTARALHHSQPPDVGRIFLTPKNKPYVLRENGGGQIAQAFGLAVTAAKLPGRVTPHTLRHTWATWFYGQTKDFGGLLDLGGWQKPEIAQGYRKIAPGDLGKRLLDHGWDFTDLDSRVDLSPRLTLQDLRPKGKNRSI
jgi:integrase